VKWVSAKKSRTTVGALMHHQGISFILATGGPGLVKAAYQSGKPAIGAGSGNAPVLVCADADLSLAACNIVLSKAFDNGLACSSENNLIVVESRVEAFTAALEAHGAAVLSAEEKERLLAVIVDPSTNPLVREKLAPLLSLIRAVDEQVGMSLSERILEFEGAGHTAIIYTHTPDLTTEFGGRMAASRILVNTPGTQGSMGQMTGLQPSMTLGCGTFGGASTTDNVTYTHLINWNNGGKRLQACSLTGL
jgi:acetaldehyde dehydrogenase / alcohol dehydrogenase